MVRNRKAMGLEGRLRRAIADCGMSQRRLAVLAGVHQPQIVRFMQGRQTLILWAAGRIAEPLGLELAPVKNRAGLEAQLRQAIADSGMNANQVSALSGVDAANLYRFLRGEHSMLLSSADKIARVLGLELRPKAERRPAPAISAVD